MKKTPAVCAIVLISATASAETFAIVGARALAMGGAGVASAVGPTASYWNPALIAMQPAGGSFLYGQGTSDPESLAPNLDDLAATNALNPDILSRPPDAVRAVGILGDIASQPTPLEGSRATGAFYSGGNFGISIHRLNWAQGTPLVDRVHTEFNADPETGLPFNQSQLFLNSLRTDDYVLTIGFDLGDQSVVVGGNVRYSRGTTHVSADSLFGFPDFTAGDVFSAAENGLEKTSSAWSFDVGTSVQPMRGLRLGITGKYLGAPEFETATGGMMTLDARWRAGVSVTAAPGLMLAGDMDLTSTGTTSFAVDQRNFSIGAEYRLVQETLALRGGYRGSLSGPDSKLMTGGVGYVGKSFRIDGSMGFSPSTHTTIWAIEISLNKQKG